MRKVFSVCLLTLIVSGCSSTNELVSVNDANRKIGDGAAIIVMTSGREYEGREVRVSVDSTQFVNRKTEDVFRFPTREVQSIQVIHRGGGAVEGLLFGGLGGGALGLALGIGLKSSGDEGMGKGLLVITGLAVGAAGGLVFGAIKGHDYTFIFPVDSIKVRTRNVDS